MSVTDPRADLPFALPVERAREPLAAPGLCCLRGELARRVAAAPFDDRPLERLLEEGVLARDRDVFDEALARADVFPWAI